MTLPLSGIPSDTRSGRAFQLGLTPGFQTAPALASPAAFPPLYGVCHRRARKVRCGDCGSRRLRLRRTFLRLPIINDNKTDAPPRAPFAIAHSRAADRAAPFRTFPSSLSACLHYSPAPVRLRPFEPSARADARPTDFERPPPNLTAWLLRPVGRPGPCPETPRKGLRPLCHSPKRCPGRAPAERFVPHLRAGALRSPGIPLTHAADRAS